MMRIPGLPVAVALVAGAILGGQFAVPPRLPLIVGLLLAVLGFVCAYVGRLQVGTCLLIMVVLLCGVSLRQPLHYEMETHIARQDLLSLLRKPVIIEGVVSTAPTKREYRTTFNVDLKRWNIEPENTVFTPVSGKITARIFSERNRGAAPEINLRSGDRIKMKGKFTLPFYMDNPAGYEIDRYYRLEGISAIISTSNPGELRVIEPGSSFRPLAWFRERAGSRFVPTYAYGRAAAGLLSALILGNREILEEGTKSAFFHAGFYHVLAISGFHLALAAGGAYSLLLLLPISFRKRLLIMLVVITFYALVVEPRVPILRAWIVLSFLFLRYLFLRMGNSINSLSWAAVFIVLYEPNEVGNMGFALTFIAALSIILGGRLLKSCDFDPYKPWWRSAIIMSLLAQLAVTPWLARFSCQAPTYAFLLFPAIVAVLSVALFFGLPGLLLSMINVTLAGPFIRIGEAACRLLDIFVKCAAELPMISIKVPSPSIWIVAAANLGLLIAFIALKERRRTLALVGIALCCSLPISWTWKLASTHLTKGVFEWTCVAVGNGDCHILRLPNGGTMVMDGGGFHLSNFDFGEKVVKPMLTNSGIHKIDILMATHSHSDHINGLVSLPDHFPVGMIWLGPCESPNYPCLPLLEQAEKRNIPVMRLKPYRDDDFRQALKFDLNDRSIALRIRYGDAVFLMMADWMNKGEAGMLNVKHLLRADVLKGGHHGGFTSSTPVFLQAVSPQAIVLPTFYAQRHIRPLKEVLDRMKKCVPNVKTYRTDLDGAIHIRTDGSTIRVRTTVTRPPRLIPEDESKRRRFAGSRLFDCR